MESEDDSRVLKDGTRYLLAGKVASYKLIEEVKKRTFLYDSNEKDYRDRDVIDQAWKDIGKQFGASGQLTKSRWQSIRGSYTRSIMNGKDQNFYLNERLSFLRPHIAMPRTFYHGFVGNTGAEERGEESVMDKGDLADLEGYQLPRDFAFPQHSLQGIKKSQKHTNSPDTTNGSMFESSLELECLDGSYADHHEELEDDKSFLRNIVKDASGGGQSGKKALKRRLTSMSEEKIEDSHKPLLNDEGDDSNAKQSLEKKIKRLLESMAERQQSTRTTDSDLVFLQGLLPQIRQLGSKRKRTVFMEITGIIFKHLDEQEEEKSQV